MGPKQRDKTDTNATQESRQAMANETGIPVNESPNLPKRSPDARRRALLAGLATTPVLLTLTNRSALGFNIDCSAFASLILGGSPSGLPEQVHNVPEHALQNMYEAQCKEGDGPGNSNGNSNGNANGKSTN